MLKTQSHGGAKGNVFSAPSNYIEKRGCDIEKVTGKEKKSCSQPFIYCIVLVSKKR